MAGLFLGVFAPPVRCVATRPRCGQPCITRRSEDAGLQRFIRHIILDSLRTRAAVRAGPLVEQVADQTHPGHIADPEFGNSFVRPGPLRMRFRKMTGWPACRQTGRRKCRLNRRPKQAMPGPLSNPPETINLIPDSRAGNRAGRGSRQRRLLRLRRSGGRPIFKVPIRFMDRTGSGDLEKCVAGCFVMAHA